MTIRFEMKNTGPKDAAEMVICEGDIGFDIEVHNDGPGIISVGPKNDNTNQTTHNFQIGINKTDTYRHLSKGSGKITTLRFANGDKAKGWIEFHLKNF